MTDLSIIAKRPDLPVIVFVDNYELAYDYDTTAQSIYKAEVTKVASWNQRVYDDEEAFINDYWSWQPEPDVFGYPTEEQIEAKARNLWKEHATECIVCYSHAAAMPKGCEIK